MLEIKKYPFYSKTMLASGPYGYFKVASDSLWCVFVQHANANGYPTIGYAATASSLQPDCVEITQEEFATALNEVKALINKIKP